MKPRRKQKIDVPLKNIRAALNAALLSYLRRESNPHERYGYKILSLEVYQQGNEKGVIGNVLPMFYPFLKKKNPES